MKTIGALPQIVFDDGHEATLKEHVPCAPDFLQYPRPFEVFGLKKGTYPASFIGCPWDGGTRHTPLLCLPSVIDLCFVVEPVRLLPLLQDGRMLSISQSTSTLCLTSCSNSITLSLLLLSGPSHDTTQSVFKKIKPMLATCILLSS
jgi:hypothetical protein